MDVQSIRNYVRTQMDVDDKDLPDTVLNVYLQEAFDRTAAFTNRWPRMETTWRVALIPGDTSVTLPPDLARQSITSVLAGDGYPLVGISMEIAEGHFTPLTSASDTSPAYYSVWGDQLYLWPRVSKVAPYTLAIRGHRRPLWTSGASDIPDCDDRLHIPLAHFALALAYAQQEDEVMEAAYMARWSRDVEQQGKQLLEPNHARPIVLHSGNPIGGTFGYHVNVPSGVP